MAKKYSPTQITELTRRFKEVAELFDEDPKQILAVAQASYIAQKQKQVFEAMLTEKRKNVVERQKKGKNAQQNTQEHADALESETMQVSESQEDEVQ
ncbi:MAG: hypothetical protein WAX22_02840 [Lactococcus hircilactis]|uniref:hypothetical protein n=1 Tax=Lactococcus hircilactis TaxID=1494462 RepID=UPI003BD71F4C